MFFSYLDTRNLATDKISTFLDKLFFSGQHEISVLIALNLNIFVNVLKMSIILDFPFCLTRDVCSY